MQNRIAALTVACLVASMGTASTAHATHKTPIYLAASEYREAVRDFERAVIRSRYLDRREERAADDLEDATSPFRSAARNPHRKERLFDTWDEVQYRQGRAAAIIFANPGCPSAAELAECWQRVLHHFDCVAAEMVACGWRPIYQHAPIYVEPPVVLPPRVEPVQPEVLPAPAPVRFQRPDHPAQWRSNGRQEFNPHWIMNSRSHIHRTAAVRRSAGVGARLVRFTW